MITKEMAVEAGLKGYGTFYHVSARNADGTAVRCRVNGKCKTWKRRPEAFRLPVKYGLKEYFYLDNGNAKEWLTVDPTVCTCPDPESLPKTDMDGSPFHVEPCPGCQAAYEAEEERHWGEDYEKALEAAAKAVPTEADLDYAYRVHGGSKVS